VYGARPVFKPLLAHVLKLDGEFAFRVLLCSRRETNAARLS